MFTDYLYRVGNAVDADLDTHPWREVSASTLAYPDRAALTLDVPARRVDFLAFLRLHRCELATLVGERNSGLGRVMGPVRRWHYEARALVAAERCLERLDRAPGTGELAETLEAVISDKRHDYPRHRWNALVAGPEWQRHFRLSETAFDPERDRASARATASALTALSRIAGDHRAVAATPITTLEDWFAAIEQNATGGKLREAARLLEATLDEAAGGVGARVSGRPLCPLNRPTPQARIAHNVFLKYYAQGLQPYLAVTLRSYERWHRAMRALLDEAGDGIDQAPAPTWLQRAAPAVLRRAVTRHTEAWQDLLNQCDLMPARPATPGAPFRP